MNTRKPTLVPARRTGTIETLPASRCEVVGPPSYGLVERSEQDMMKDILRAQRSKSLMEHTAMLYSGADTLGEMVPSAQPALRGIADQYARYAITELSKEGK